jgi:hypothetical protein
MNIEVSLALDTFSIVYMLILLLNLGRKNKAEVLDSIYFLVVIVICIFLSLDIAYLSLYGRATPFPTQS